MALGVTMGRRRWSRIWAQACCLLLPLAAAAGEAPPAGDDGVVLHVIQPRDPATAGRLELSLSGIAQVNQPFTDHLGLGAQATYHLDEALAFYAGGIYYPYTRESGFADQLLASASLVPSAQGQLLVRWAAGAGVEFSPIYGKFAWSDSNITRFAVFVRAGAGVASSRIWLAPSGAGPGPLLGDAGMRFTGSLGLGARLGLSRRIGLRLELRDDFFPAGVSRVNGCDAGDLAALSASGSSAQVKPSCDAAAFAQNGYAGVNAAQNAVQSPSSGLVHQVAVLLGVGFILSP